MTLLYIPKDHAASSLRRSSITVACSLNNLWKKNIKEVKQLKKQALSQSFEAKLNVIKISDTLSPGCAAKESHGGL